MPNIPDIRNRISEIRKKLSEFRHLKSDFRIGFTLIELLVVITLIALLIGVAAASYSKAQQKGRDGKRKTDLKAIQQALELYFQQNGKYPPLSNGIWCARIFHTNYPQLRDALSPSSGTKYINQIPQDPQFSAGTSTVDNSDYVYRNLSWTGYELAASLENTNDPDKSASAYTQFNSCPGTTDGVYNYRVINP